MCKRGGGGEEVPDTGCVESRAHQGYVRMPLQPKSKMSKWINESSVSSTPCLATMTMMEGGKGDTEDIKAGGMTSSTSSFRGVYTYEKQNNVVPRVFFHHSHRDPSIISLRSQ